MLSRAYGKELPRWCAPTNRPRGHNPWVDSFMVNKKDFPSLFASRETAQTHRGSVCTMPFASLDTSAPGSPLEPIGGRNPMTRPNGMAGSPSSPNATRTRQMDGDRFAPPPAGADGGAIRTAHLNRACGHPGAVLKPLFHQKYRTNGTASYARHDDRWPGTAGPTAQQGCRCVGRWGHAFRRRRGTTASRIGTQAWQSSQ